MSDSKEHLYITPDYINKIIQTDKTIKHYRINIINGVEEVFDKYKQKLNNLTYKNISTRFYKNHEDLYKDLFVDTNFMSKDWFNLFVFNIGKNGKSIIEEINGIDKIHLELRNKFDTKKYSILIVSSHDKSDIIEQYETNSNSYCPIKNQRYLKYDFSQIELLQYINNILYTHSFSFLTRWQSALDKLENYQHQKIALAE